MTENQNNKGRGVSGLILTLIVLLGFLSSCTSLRPAPSNTIKVLAVTAEGDTIQLDVNSLRPRVYQNIYHTYLLIMIGVGIIIIILDLVELDLLM